MKTARIFKYRIPSHASPESYKMRAKAFGIKVVEEREDFVSFVSEIDRDAAQWHQVLNNIFFVEKPPTSSLS